MAFLFELLYEILALFIISAAHPCDYYEITKDLSID